jgi:DUF218 domain-containing protein
VRLVAVLGYSDGRSEALHGLCAARLEHAEEVAESTDAVLFSGWGRRDCAAEAELMRAAWKGHGVTLLTDSHARNTMDNAASVADAARQLNVGAVIVVTSWWHAFRARLLVRAVLPKVAVHSSSAAGRPPARLLLRELGCLLALPYQLMRVRARRGW